VKAVTRNDIKELVHFDNTSGCYDIKLFNNACMVMDFSNTGTANYNPAWSMNVYLHIFVLSCVGRGHPGQELYPWPSEYKASVLRTQLCLSIKGIFSITVCTKENVLISNTLFC
jgi:hypothetical protein